MPVSLVVAGGLVTDGTGAPPCLAEVNGTPVVDGGQLTGATPGRRLRRTR